MIRNLALGLVLWGAVLPTFSWAKSAPIRGKDIPWIDPKTFNTAEIDLWIRLGMSERRIPGLGIVIVQGDQILHKKAYGLSQPQSGVMADPDKTVWRVASVSKLFTVHAIMQLVEQGKIGLDEPIARYIESIGLPEFPGKPLTLRHLLTHTGGFDEIYVGIARKRPEDLVTIERWLHDFRPQLIQPPGVSTAYSNYGFTLAGYVLEKVTGLPFSRYLAEKVFKPLQMQRSTFEPREDLSPDLAQGHEFIGPRLVTVKRDYIQSVPASSLETTIEDMSHFLIAQLNGGKYNGRSVVSSASMAEIHKLQFTNHPEISGFALSYFDREQRGVRFLAHGGDARGCNAFVVIYPEQKLAFFLAYNRFSNDLGGAFHEWFLDQFILEGKSGNLNNKPTISPEDMRRSQLAAGKEDLRIYHGVYRFNRHPHRSFTKLGAFLGGLANELRITSTPDGRLEVIPLPWSRETRSFWSPLGDGVFVNEKTGAKIIITKKNGRGEDVYRGADGAFNRIPMYDSIYVHLVVLGFCEFIFLSYLFWSGFTWFRYWSHRRLRKVVARRVKAHFEVRAVQSLFIIVSALNVVIIPAWAGALFMMNPIELAYGVPSVARILLSVPWVGAILSGIMAVLAFRMWFRKELRPPLDMRLKFMAGSVVAALYFLVIGHWNFFGYWD